METEDKVAPILNSQKLKSFLTTLFSTLTGYSLYPCSHPLLIIFNITFPFPSLFLFLFTFLSPQQYTIIAIISTVIPTVFIWVWLILKYCLIDRKENNEQSAITLSKLVLGFILAPISCYLTFNHFYISRGDITIAVLSFITCLGSVTTIYSSSTRQFGVMNEENSISCRSTTYIRVYITSIILILQTIFYFLQFSSAVMVLKYIYCFSFVLWRAGFLSDLASTAHIFVNWANLLVFGEQKKVRIYRAIISLSINAAISIGLMAIPRSSNSFAIINCVLMAVALLTSSLTNTLGCFTLNSEKNHKHYYLQYILELLLLAGKILLTVFIPVVETNSLLIILGIDLLIFLVLSLLSNLGRAKTLFGTKQLYTIPSPLRVIFRLIMRSIIDICFVFLAHRLLTSSFYQTYPFLTGIFIYRSYKRSIYQPFSFGIHLSFVLGMALNNLVFIWLIPLCMVPLPDNCFLLFIASCVIPKKNVRKCESVYIVLYVLASIIGLGIVCISLGLLEPIMLFGLPVFLWSLPISSEPVQNGHGKDKSIHQHLAVNLKKAMSEYDVGTYLLRVSKYLIIFQVVQRGIGYQIVQFRGLEAQEVTSCHGIEAQTVDNLVEQVWGDKTQCGYPHLFTVLTPLQKHPYSIFESNEFSLTGLIDTRQFAVSLKKNYVKTLLYLMSKQKYQEQYKLQLQKATKQIHEIISEEQVKKYMFSQFMSALGITLVENNKKVLPPIRKEQKEQVKPQPPAPLKKSQDMFDDFNFMMSPDKRGNKENQDNKATTLTIQAEQSDTNLLHNFQSKKKEESYEESPKSLGNASVFDMAVVLCVYSFGSREFIDQKKLFELLSSASSAEKALKNVNLPPKGKLANKAVRFAFKLTVEQYTEGEEESSVEDIRRVEESDYYVGVLGDPEFQQAVENKIESIWCLDYKQGVKVSRYSEREIELYVFSLDPFIAKSVWNNLRFQLLYATNDDDQRYSIQTHPHFLRNILVEGSIEPYGYSPYYSGYQKIEDL